MTQALAAIDESPLPPPDEVAEMKGCLQPLEAMIDAALGRLGLGG